MPAPSAPNTPVLQTGNGQNLISWDLVSGATSYKVQRSTDGVTFSILASPAVNFLVDSTALVGTQYYYQVAAHNGSGDSAFVASYPEAITPCLPGQINLGYLRYMSQLKADKLHSQYLTVDEWNWNINQSMYELRDLLVTKFGEDYFLAPPLIFSINGSVNYPLPDGANYDGAPALFKLTGIDCNMGGNAAASNAGWTPLSRANWSDRDRYTTFPAQAGALNNVYQMSYRMMGDKIWFFPQNMNMTLRMLYIPIMNQLLLDTDMLNFSLSGWSEYIVLDAAIKAMDKEESFEKVASLSQKKEFQVSRIEAVASNRDVGQPNTVSNVRQTMGDPGFSNWGGGFGGGGFGGY